MLDSKVSQINVFRLVLSNQSKQWISAEGVEKIQLVSEVTLLLAYYSYDWLVYIFDEKQCCGSERLFFGSGSDL